MNFKDFLLEAETVDRQRMESEPAALRILAPFQHSKWHVVTMVDGPQHPLHTPRQGSIIDCIPVQEFMDNGFSGWQADDVPGPRYVVVLEVNKTAQIRCLDGTHMSNPWQWKNFDVPGMKQAARGFPEKEISPAARRHWERIAQQKWTGEPDPTLSDEERNAKWRAELAKTIYGDLPNVYAKGRSSANYNDKYYQRYGKVLRGGDIDIVAERCPLNKGGMIRIFNPRIVREINRFQVQSSFKGFRRLEGGFLTAQSSGEKERSAVEQKLNDLLHDLEGRPQNTAINTAQVVDLIQRAEQEEVSDEIASGVDFLSSAGFDVIPLTLWKASRLIGMMRRRSGQDFSEIWDQVIRYDLPHFEEVFANLKKIADFANRNLPDYKREAEKLSQVRAKMIRSLLALADVCGQAIEPLRVRLGI